MDEKYLKELEKEVIKQKTETTEKLFALLKTTSEYERVFSMKYVRGASATPYSEAVIVEWRDGVRGAINVHMDSPLAMIKDVFRHIDETRYEKE